MKTVGTYELKTNLSEILAEVKAGESVVVTCRGEPIARIIPETSLTTAEAFHRLFEKRKNHRLAGTNWRELRDAGRK